MDSIFVWILMFAGAAVALLGIFLVASERELKTKRHEIQRLLARLESQSERPKSEREPRATDGAYADLLARNRELEDEIRMLASDLAQSRKAIDELQVTQNADAAAQETIRRLTSANEQLNLEAAALRGRLSASEGDVDDDRRQDNAAISRMQIEVDELRRALQTSAARVTELEEARTNAPDLNALTAERETERQSFRLQIADLESHLAEQRRELAEAEHLRERIAQAEQGQQALRDEIARYQNEITGWQARLASAEACASRLAALQAPFQELLSKQAGLTERQRHFQEELAAFARQIAAYADDRQLETPERASAARPVQTIGETDSAREVSSSSKLVATEESDGARMAQRSEAASASPTDPKTRRFGVFGLILFTVATGIVFVQFLGSEWEQPSAEVATAQTAGPAVPAKSPSPAIQRKPDIAPEPSARPARIAPQPAKFVSAEKPTIVARDDRTSVEKRAPIGAYKVTRRSRVYAAPNQHSRSLGDIEAGVNVNVVSAQNGWLEIHSKHGRPPGFIRQEVAAQVAGAD